MIHVIYYIYVLDDLNSYIYIYIYVLYHIMGNPSTTDVVYEVLTLLSLHSIPAAWPANSEVCTPAAALLGTQLTIMLAQTGMILGE